MRTFVAALLILLLPAAAQAHGFTIGPLTVGHPWSRATVPTAEVGGGYLVVVNEGSEDDRLLAVESAVAGRVELHEMANENGVMKMRPLAEGIALPAGATVTLAPGGLHVMFLGLAGPFVEGERFPATLVFEKAGRLEVEFKVEPMDYAPEGSSEGGEGHGHGHGS